MEATDILEIKKDNFKKMKRLAEEQEKIALSHDSRMKEFLILSDKRERLRNEIDSDNKKYDALSLGNSRKEDREKTRSINMEIYEIIESIQELDERIERLVTEKKNNILKDISRLRKGQNAVRSYGQRAKNQPRFLERRG